jgi:uncharacterized protein with HEPN domain
MSRSWNIYLKDILGAIHKIEIYTQDLDFLSFCQDERTVDAVIRNLMVIGEAVKNIPEDIRQVEPEIEWRKIAGLRDFAAHAYFNVSNEIVWDVVENKLSTLAEAVTRILDCNL